MSYASLGLRHNPFTAEATPGVAPPLFVDDGRAAPRPGQGQFVQVIGIRGAGKTSLLLHWQRASYGPYIHVDLGLRRWRPVPVAPLVYWDEADRLPAAVVRRALAAASRSRGTVVVGTHEDMGSAAVAAGMQLREVHPITPTPHVVLEWAARRIAGASLPDRKSTLELSYDQAGALADACGGSWRVIGDRLHSWAAIAARGHGERSTP